MTPGHAYHHGNLRATLEILALQQLEAVGEESLSLRGLAERAGVSKMAPYKHFADKGALLSDLARAGFRQLNQAFSSCEGSQGSLVYLSRLARVYVDFALNHANLYALMVKRGDDSGQAFAVLRSAVAVAQTAGWHSTLDANRLALAVWASLHGLADLNLRVGAANDGTGGRMRISLDEVLALLGLPTGESRDVWS